MIKKEIDHKMFKITEEDEKEAIENKQCPVCKGKKFWRSIVGKQKFEFDENGRVFFRDRIECSRLDPEFDVVFCRKCQDSIPKRIWKEWFNFKPESFQPEAKDAKRR